MLPNHLVELVGAQYLVGVPFRQDPEHDLFHIVQVGLRLQRVVHAVVPLPVELFVGDFRVVAEMGATGGFDQPVRHQGPRGNDCVHDAAIDQLRDDQSLLGHRHGAGERHYFEAVLVAGHRFQHVGRLAQLPPGKRRFGHASHQVVN